eukprot:COSAG01_NODE_635_length_14662_cov_12.488773_6_plen_250_part_00
MFEGGASSKIIENLSSEEMKAVPSATRMQTLLELAIKIDKDHDGKVTDEEMDGWASWVRDSSVWIGNIPIALANNAYLIKRLEDKFGGVAAMTVRRYKTEEENATRDAWISEQTRIGTPRGARGRGHNIRQHRSWAIVTFFNKSTAIRAVDGKVHVRFRSDDPTGKWYKTDTMVRDLLEIQKVDEDATGEHIQHVLKDHRVQLLDHIQTAIVSLHAFMCRLILSCAWLVCRGCCIHACYFVGAECETVC